MGANEGRLDMLEKRARDIAAAKSARPSASSVSGTRGTQRTAIFGSMPPLVLRLPQNALGYASIALAVGKLVRLIYASWTAIVVRQLKV